MWYGWKTWLGALGAHGAHEVDTQHATAAQGVVGHGVGHVVAGQLQHVAVLQLVHWAQVVAGQLLVVAAVLA
jgi:hypothetical protein